MHIDFIFGTILEEHYYSKLNNEFLQEDIELYDKKKNPLKNKYTCGGIGGKEKIAPFVFICIVSNQ